MMESAQNRHHDDSMIGRQLVALQRDHAIRRRIWKPRSQTAWPARLWWLIHSEEWRVDDAPSPESRSPNTHG